MSSAYVGAYWGPRSADVAAAARAFVATVAAVQEVTGATTWYLPADSASAALARPVRPDEVEALLAAGRAFRDHPAHEAMPELGWRLRLWDGGDVSVALLVGATSTVVPNSVLVQFEFVGAAPDPRWSDVLRTVVDLWAPEWATVSSDDLRTAQSDLDLDPVVLGWATYLGPAYPAPHAFPSLPVGVLLEPCGEGRLLRFADPASVGGAAVEELRRAIRRPPAGPRHEASGVRAVAERRGRQQSSVVVGLAGLVPTAALVLRQDPHWVAAAITASAFAVPLGYPFLVNLRRPRARTPGEQRWRTLVAYGDMAATSSAVPAAPGRVRSTGEAFGRLSVSDRGWHWEPEPRSARIGFGSIDLPPSWRVVDQGRVRSGVFTSHITVGGDDDPRTVTFWCTATTAAEVVTAC